MQTLDDISRYLRQFVGVDWILAAQTREAEFCVDGLYVDAPWFRFFSFCDIRFVVAASEHRQVIIHHDAIDTGEDGIEPAYVQTLDYHFLEVTPEPEHDSTRLCAVSFPYGPINSIDIFVARFDLASQSGPTLEERFCGFRVNLSETNVGPDTAFGLLQRAPNQRVHLGMASRIFSDLPQHISLWTTLS